MNHRDLQKPSCSDSGTLPLEGIGMCTSHRLDRGIKQFSIFFPSDIHAPVRYRLASHGLASLADKYPNWAPADKPPNCVP